MRSTTRICVAMGLAAAVAMPGWVAHGSEPRMRGKAPVSVHHATRVAGPASRDARRQVTRQEGYQEDRRDRREVSREVSREFRRDVDIDRDIDINVDVDHGWDHGWDDDHPFARAAAVTAGVMVTHAVIGSIVNSVPPGCVTTVVNGIAYQQCGSAWYEPRYYGSSVQYIVVNPPY